MVENRLGDLHQITITGRAFFIGDLHGERQQLSLQLGQVGFDPSRGDQLISVGDLADRGPNSPACLELLEKSWFHSVLGNHEVMLLSAMSGSSDMDKAWQRCGGGWFSKLPDEQRQRLISRSKVLLESLPVALEVHLPNLNATIGVIHADCPYDDWSSFREKCGQGLDEEARATALWSRKTLKELSDFKYPKPISGIDVVVLGHTPQSMFRCVGNRLWLDTGAGYRDGRLTLLSAEQVIEVTK